MNIPPPPPNWQPPFVPVVTSKPHKPAPPRRGLGVGAIVAIAVVAVVAVAGIVIGLDEIRIWNLKRHIGNEFNNVVESFDDSLADGFATDADDCDKRIAEMIATAKAEGRSLTEAESEKFTTLRQSAKDLRAAAAKLRAKPAAK